MKRTLLSLFAILLSVFSFSQTPVPMSSQPGLSYTEGFGDIAAWSNGFASGIGANRFASVVVNATGTIPDGVRITTATSSFSSGTSGGVQRGTQAIMLLSTGATDNTSSAAFDFFMDFSGVNAGTLSFDWASINNSTGDRRGSLRVYYSTDGTSFTEIPAAQVLNFTNNSPTNGSITTVSLPSAFNNSATARLRFYYHNAAGGTTGSRPKISIDNLTVTALASGNSVFASAGTNAAENSNGSLSIDFAPATSVSSAISYSFGGSATFGIDYTVSFSVGDPSTATASGILENIPVGTSSITVTIIPNEDLDVEGTETITLDISNPPAGYTIGTANAQISLLDNDVAPEISVAAGTNAAEPSTNGTLLINFNTATTVSTTLDFSFTGVAAYGTDYTVSYSSGSAGAPGASGTLTVPAGTTSVTITITPIDDTDVESSESIILTISNPGAGYVIGTPSANINITSNDVLPTVVVAPGLNASEPSNNGTFVFTLNTAAPAGGVTINYSLTGTASAADYTDPQAGTITIAQGNFTATVNMNVTDDPDVESAETITLTIDNVTSPYTIATASANISLLDNDIAPISLTGIYTQDFNTLASAGTTNALNLPGWGLLESGGGARDNELYAADNGGSTTGDTYSYGTAAGERALGGLSSGSLTPSFGAYFINNTGSTVSTLRINYTGKQWRLGSAGRTDRFDFQYSIDAVNLGSGTWIDYDPLDFLTPNTVTTGIKNGNDPINQTITGYTITGLSIPDGATIFIRWNDSDASGSDDGLSIDDLSVEINPVDNAGPAIVALSPAHNSIAVPVYVQASISFNEDIIKGTGNIYVKRASDNVVIQTINVSAAAVTTSANKAFFIIEGLAFSTAYYVEIDAGAFTDVGTNPSVAFNTWSFTTVDPPAAGIVDHLYSFDNCTTSIPDGFTQFSSTGSVVWTCTNFGRNPHTGNPLSDSTYGVQMNGFFGGTNTPNVDWMISPSFDLTTTTYPLLSFYSRTAFNGPPLQLRISTDYVSGNPASATWTDLNGRFPGLASNSWTLSSDINLSAFKGANVHIAFVYFSSEDDGARWTLDDILVTNSAVPPPPSLTVSTSDIQFSFVAAGSSADKTFTFTGNDLTEDVTINATGDFAISKDGVSFSNSLLYTIAEANNISKTVYVRFNPSVNGQNFTGTVNLATATLSSTINLKGTSIDPATTLEVVNWNIEWFGSTLEGPTNDAQQEQNVKNIMENVNADIFAFVEVVDESRLAAVVAQLPGYSYVVSNYGSHTNTTVNPPSSLNTSQKMAYVYKTALFSNVTTTALLSQGINSPADMSNPAYNYWASGRFPYMLSADVTLNCITKHVKFVLVHGKANTSPTDVSYARRKNGADSLHYTLNSLYPNDNIVILGDFNDDLDQSITAGFTTTSWDAFTTDAANYSPITLPLSLAGKKSTVAYSDMIDHVVVSNEMDAYYMDETANVLTDVTSLVTNYGSTTSDHYPIFSRFRFEQPAAPTINCPADIVQANNAGSCGAIVNYVVDYVSNCGEGTITQTTGLASGSVFPAGVTTNTFVVNDGAGNTATCTFTVTINDTTAPVITCPANISTASGSGCGAIVNYTVPFEDNCAGATFTQTAGLPSGAEFPAGTTTNTFLVTDAAGNTNTCSFTVTVVDGTAPTFTRPADITIPFTGACTYNASVGITGTATNLADNCAGVLNATYSDVIGGCGNEIVITRTWMLSDNAGNAAAPQVQTITVSDNATPYIILAEKEASFGEDNYINGAVGVKASNGEASFKKGTMLLLPHFVRARNIEVKNGATVQSKIYSPATNGPNPPFFYFSGNVSGLPNRTITSSTAIPVSANYKELKIKKNVSVTVTGTLYGKIIIEEGASVTFNPTGGILNIENLEVSGKKNEATHIHFSNCTSVRIKNKVKLDKNIQLNTGGPRVIFYLGDLSNDDEKFKVEGGSNNITANVYLLKGRLKVDGDKHEMTTMTGWFIAEKVETSGKNITWNPNDCNSSAFKGVYTKQTETVPEILVDKLEVTVMPNPSTTNFNLHIRSNDNSPVTVRITDLSGRIVGIHRQVIPGTVLTIGTNLKAGVYFTEVSQGKERNVTKIIRF